MKAAIGRHWPTVPLAVTASGLFWFVSWPWLAGLGGSVLLAAAWEWRWQRREHDRRVVAHLRAHAEEQRRRQVLAASVLRGDELLSDEEWAAYVQIRDGMNRDEGQP